MVAVPVFDRYGSSVFIKVPARARTNQLGRGPLGSCLSAQAPPSQSTECRGSWMVGGLQPRTGHGPGFLSADKCKISFLAAGGEAWLLPSEQQEGSGQLPGPQPLPCPLNCSKPQPLRSGESRPGLPPQSPGQQICDKDPAWGWEGSWQKSREREKDCVKPFGQW